MSTALTYSFGTPWLDHFNRPVGNGAGCEACDRAHETDYTQAGKVPKAKPMTRFGR
jgi:hypothetical protein